MQPAPGWIPPPPANRRPSSQRRVPVLAVLGGLLGLLTVGALAAHRPLLKWMIDAQASALGLSLRYDELEVGLGTVSITKARFGLLGQKTLVGEAARVDFDPSLFGASRVTAQDGRVIGVGPLRTILEGVSRWRSRHGDTSGIEVAGRNLTLELRDDAAGAPWLQLTGASATPSGKGGLLRAAQTTVFGLGVGATSLGWQSRSQGLSLWLGEAGEAASHSRMEVLSTSTPTVRVAMKNAPLASLAQPLGLPGAGGASVDAQAELVFPAGQGMQGGFKGVVQGVTLAGTEWSGLTLGPTQFGSKVVSNPEGTQVTFDGLSVQSGGMGMQGSASWTRQATGGALQGQLAGVVPCGMMARNAVAAGLGGPLGNLAGAVVGAAIGGQVTIALGFQFDTQNPRAGRVSPQIGVGCNLQAP